MKTSYDYECRHCGYTVHMPSVQTCPTCGRPLYEMLTDERRMLVLSQYIETYHVLPITCNDSRSRWCMGDEQ